jgi:transcriptional regulator GlxA family with amidase domain
MHSSPRTQPARFGILVYEGVEPIDIGGTVGVLSMARRVLPHLEYVVIAESIGPVALAGGLAILAQADFASHPPCDLIIVPGGPGWREQVARQPLLDFLRRQAPDAVASVCTGGLILAAAGILKGRRATTRRMAIGGEVMAPQELLASFGDVKAVVAAVVEDGGVVTAGGVCLAIDATLYLIARLYGEDARGEVARIIEYDRALAANRACLGYL